MASQAVAPVPPSGAIRVQTAAWNAPALFAELDEDLSGEGLLLGAY